MRDLLGGKGANVAEMTRVLGAGKVPAGFTITTEACVAYMQSGGEFPDGLDQQVAEASGEARGACRQGAGRPGRPAAGLGPLGCARVDAGHARHRAQPGPERPLGGRAGCMSTGNERFACDSYRRLIQMFGNVVRDIPGERFEQAIAECKAQAGVELDTELSAPTTWPRWPSASRASTRRRSRRTRAPSCGRPSARCSTPGPAIGRSSTAASTTSRTSGAPP